MHGDNLERIIPVTIEMGIFQFGVHFDIYTHLEWFCVVLSCCPLSENMDFMRDSIGIC